MRRPAVIAFLVVAVAGIAVAALLGATRERTLAFTLGVPTFGPVATLAPGQVACQQPIPVGGAFDAIELQPGVEGRATPPLDVTVLRAGDRAQLARGALPGGRPGGTRQTVTVGDVPRGGEIAVCIRNAGRRPVALGGGPDVTAQASNATLGGRALEADVDLVFRTTDERSTLAALPDVLDRAALFRAGWIGPWLYWLLLAAVLLGVPALLALALGRASSRESEPPGAD